MSRFRRESPEAVVRAVYRKEEIHRDINTKRLLEAMSKSNDSPSITCDAIKQLKAWLFAFLVSLATIPAIWFFNG